MHFAFYRYDLPDELSQKLRTGKNPIFGRISQEQLLLDLRTVLPRHDVQLVDAIAALGSAATAPSEADGQAVS